MRGIANQQDATAVPGGRKQQSMQRSPVDPVGVADPVAHPRDDTAIIAEQIA